MQYRSLLTLLAACTRAGDYEFDFFVSEDEVDDRHYKFEVMITTYVAGRLLCRAALIRPAARIVTK